jgi:hypothetical protein
MYLTNVPVLPFILETMILEGVKQRVVGEE